MNKTPFKRILNITNLLGEMSLLLLGPRQTGKSTYLEDRLEKPYELFNLLDPEIFRDLQKDPKKLLEQSRNSNNLIVIDEIQKIPELMDIVHMIIQKNKSIRFVLTGSSARKLKSSTGNLLGGRAYPIHLHPICSAEYLEQDKTNNLDTLLSLGGLPSVLTSSQPQKRLKAYIGLYLQEEIKAEGYVRHLADFSKFLDVAALTNTEQLDFEGVASDCQLSARTIASYYQILQDTLLGYLIEPYRKTKTRKAVATPKFYFFDVGVANYLVGREHMAKGTPEYGKAMEHFIFTELIAYRDYLEKDFKIYFWRSTSKFEVDFLIETKNKKLIAIESKAKKNVTKKDYTGISAFEEDLKLSRKIVVSLEERSRTTDENVEIMSLVAFCQKLWNEELF